MSRGTGEEVCPSVQHVGDRLMEECAGGNEGNDLVATIENLDDSVCAREDGDEGRLKKKLTGASCQLVARDSNTEERELVFLMAHALQNVAGLEGVGAELSRRALELGVFPNRMDYLGHEHAYTDYEDVANRYDYLPRTALIDALRLLRRERFTRKRRGEEQLGRLEEQDEDACVPASLLDRRILGEYNSLYQQELKKRPSPWLGSMPSMHHGMGGENVTVYSELRRVGLLKEVRDGVGLGIRNRHRWDHQFTVRGHSMAAYCVVYDRTGDLIITGSDDRLVKIWSSRTGLLLRSCRGHLQEVSDLTVSHDNKVLASASVDGSIRLWNIDRSRNGGRDDEFGNLLGALDGHTSLVSSLNFSPVRDHELLSSSFDGTCRVWDIRDGSFVSMEWNWRARSTAGQGPNMNLRRRDDHDDHDDGVRLRRRQRDVHVDVVSDGEPEQEEQDDRKVSIALFSCDGRHIIAGIANSNICVWQWHPAGDNEGPMVTRVELLHGAHQSDVYLLQQSHAGSWMASASRDGMVCVWKPGKGGHHRRLVPIDTWKFVCSFSAPIEEDDARSRRRKGPPPRVDQIVWNADDTMVLTSVQNFRVLVYSVHDGKVMGELAGVHEEPVHVVLAHPYDPRIAVTASYSGEVVVWDILDGSPLKIFYSTDTRPDGRKWPDPIAYVDGFMSPDGHYAALTDAAGQLHVIGIGERDDWIDRAPYDQFLSTDYEDLIVDSEGVVRSAATNDPADARQASDVLCDATATPYPHGFQVAYREGNLLSSPWRDVAWIQPGQQPGYVMAAPTLTAAQWRVYASGGSENAAQQALTRAQLRLQEHERQIDMPGDAPRNNVANNNNNNAMRRALQRDRLWETISDDDLSDELGNDGEYGGRRQPRRPSRQSERLAALGDDNADEVVDIEEVSEEQQRARQQVERERRLRRRELARTRGRQALRQSNRSRRNNTTIPEDEFLSEPESSDDDVSVVSEGEETAIEEAGPSRTSRRGRRRKRDESVEHVPASQHREMRHIAWLMSHTKLEGLYIPQKGDEVVYIRKGHEAALEQYNDGLPPPWESLRMGSGIRPAEPCVVKKITYFIAQDNTEGTAATLTLELSDPDCPLQGNSFDVNLYSPLSGLADYVVLKSLFDASVRYQWTHECECKTMFWNDEHEDWFTGKILEDKLTDFHVLDHPYENAEQLWERFGVQWIGNDGNNDEFSYHCPWELRRVTTTPRSSYDRETIENRIKERMKSAIVEAAKNDNWDVFQIAPFMSDAYHSRRGSVEFYNTVVALPIGLVDISSRVENNYYRRPAALERDICLLAENAKEFNGAENSVYHDAKKLERFLLAVLDGSADAADAEVYSGRAISESEDEVVRRPQSRQRTRATRQTRSTRRAPTRPQRRTRQRSLTPESTDKDEEPDLSSDDDSSSSSSSSDDQDSDMEPEQQEPRENPGRRQPRSTTIRLRTRRNAS